MKKAIAILGAGPAGLSLAYKLLKKYRNDIKVVIFEKEMQEGGICASFSKHGLYLDYGSHRLHPYVDKEIFTDIQNMLGGQLLKRARKGRVFLMNKFVKFPLEIKDSLLHLPPKFLLGFSKDLLEKSFSCKINPSINFQDVLVKSYGKYICDKFFFPYAKKLWGLEPRLLSAQQAILRMHGDIWTLIIKTIASAFSNFDKNRAVYYYPSHGFGQIMGAYRKEIERLGGEILLGHEVAGIKMLGNSGFEIKTKTYPGKGDANVSKKQEELKFKFVFSTIPLRDLASIFKNNVNKDVMLAADKLNCRGAIFHYLILSAQQFTKYDAHYFPEQEYSISRISETKNYYQGTSPVGVTCICSEIPCDVDSDIYQLPDEKITETVLKDLYRCGLEVCVQIVDSFVIRKTSIYPVYDLNYAVNFELVDNYFMQVPNLISLGRQGLFVHDNVHHALDMGYKASECIDQECRWNGSKWKLVREGFKNNVVIN